MCLQLIVNCYAFKSMISIIYYKLLNRLSQRTTDTNQTKKATMTKHFHLKTLFYSKSENMLEFKIWHYRERKKIHSNRLTYNRVNPIITGILRHSVLLLSLCILSCSHFPSQSKPVRCSIRFLFLFLHQSINF